MAEPTKTTRAKAAPKAEKVARAPAKKAAVAAVEEVEAVAETSKESLKDQAITLANRAGDTAKEYAATGKDKASDALDDLARIAGDFANTVDSRFGTTYGNYVRKAAEAVSGTSDSLKSKEVDELVSDARNFVREKPAVAIGAAAAAGFVLMRMLKGGSGGNDNQA